MGVGSSHKCKCTYVYMQRLTLSASPVINVRNAFPPRVLGAQITARVPGPARLGATLRSRTRKQGLGSEYESL
jgi:hypothetical protein